MCSWCTFCPDKFTDTQPLSLETEDKFSTAAYAPDGKLPASVGECCCMEEKNDCDWMASQDSCTLAEAVIECKAVLVIGNIVIGLSHPLIEVSEVLM